MQPQELEERLYHQLFGVMTAARDALTAAPIYEAACTSLVSHLQLTPMTISRRFVAMRGFFVLGTSLAAEHPLRPVLFEALQNTDLLVPPPLATDDWLKLSLRNNHLLVQAAAILVWPEAQQARACAEDLTARYLAEMTDDGLFPAELCRGASCLWYSNMAAMLLTAIAKISARDGRAPIVKTQDLSRAIEGFGLALSWPPEVQSLARQNLYPHPNHGSDPTLPDRGFLQGYHRSRHYLAWVPLAQSLLPDQKMPAVPSPDDQFPLANDFIGGFADHLLAVNPRQLPRTQPSP